MAHTRAWRWTVGSGIALLVLVVVHLVANHFVVDEVGGLRTYRQVLEYIGHPVILATEIGFLLAVTVHAMLGLRGVLLDLEPTARVRRAIDAGLVMLGTSTVAYGVFLILTLAARA